MKKKNLTKFQSKDAKKKKKKKKRKRYSNKIFKYGRKREHWSIIVDQFALTSPKLAWPVSLACCWALT